MFGRGPPGGNKVVLTMFARNFFLVGAGWKVPLTIIPLASVARERMCAGSFCIA